MKRKTGHIRFLKQALLILCLTFPVFLISQNNHATLKRKKIGLVLSGGGAKGMAHIGILKVMDSLRLKIDFVGGTSMGSVVGSLYACGYTGKEIESRLKKMDWPELFNDAIPLNEVSIEEKPDHGRFLLELSFRKGKIVLPGGIIRGRNLYNEFVKLTFPVVDKTSFDSLPIPLRINAVNLLTGENVVFTKGFLPSAMRASMSIPSVFYPVEIDSGYFVDGGVIRNTLIPEIKAMGSDYTIVSFTGNKLASKKELSSVTSILEHVFFITGSRDIGQHEKEADLFIQPKLSSGDAGSFKKATLIINSGTEAAMLKFNELAKLGEDSLFEKYKTPPTKEHNDEEILNEKFIIGDTHYQNLSEEQQRFFVVNTGIHTNTETTLKEFFKEIKNGYSTLRYDYIYYEFVFKGYTADGKKKLDINFKVNESAKTKLRIGLHYDTDFGAGLMLNVIARDLLIKRSRLVFEADVAENPRAKLSYLFFLDKKYRVLLGTLNQFEKDVVQFYNNKLATESYQMTIAKSYTYLQFKFSKKLVLNTGYEFEYNNIQPKVSADSLYIKTKSLNIKNHAILTYLQYNTLNRPLIPTKGLRFQLIHRYIFSSKAALKLNKGYRNEIDSDLSIQESTYNKLTAFLEGYVPLSKKVSYYANLDYGMIFDDYAGIFDQFFLGSVEKNRSRLIPQYGYRNSELSARNFATVNIGIQYNIFKALYLKAGYAASVLNDDSYKLLFKNITDLNATNNMKTSGIGLTASYLVPKLGPISITVHKGFDRKFVFVYFTFGYKFQLM